MPLDHDRARPLLQSGDFARLFREELGWEPATQKLGLRVEGQDFALAAFAEKRGFTAWLCECADGRLPSHSTRLRIDRALTETSFEHLIVFATPARDRQSWLWVRREPGKPVAPRTHEYFREQPGESLLQKLDSLYVSFEDEEAGINVAQIAGRARAAFDVERVTKQFYRDFDTHRKAFVKFIEGIAVVADREWYASVMLNRLMFVYFIQRKGFLDADRDYLRHRLARCQQEHGRDKFYSFYRYFLLRLFHEGFGRRRAERSPEFERLLGRVPYLNGGLFDVHELERPERYGRTIEIADKAFERVFAYFDQYQWHLDERPLRADNEINPDVLGYIFEKYINQKQMGAYYTKEDITEYIGKNTILPFLLDAARARCRVAFDHPGGPTVWDHLRSNPDRYIYAPVRQGVDLPLPPEIAAGLNPPGLTDPVPAVRSVDDIPTIRLRKAWNRPAPPEHALPTEIWREVVARRQRCLELRRKLGAGEVHEVSDLITLNLDIRQFVQDVIASCEGPDLLRAIWHALEKVTVLDPTCGSGAFLFAALNLLEPLYEACLDRMEAFVGDLDRSGEKHRPEKFADFRMVLERVRAHPNRRYFVFKSIILQNLYGVDIMEEAVEICKLRLFLKLAAQVSPDPAKENLGIEPLPDIDFNVRAGNTLVGYATYDEVKKAVLGDEQATMDFDNAIDKIAVKAADLQQAFDAFRRRQTEGDGSVPAAHKQELRKRLTALRDELNHYLATDYGVKVKDKDVFAKWRGSHQPFHWFVEFYGIMSGGGFNVIIGNPPYLEYSKVEGYSVKRYKTERSANLYAFTLERAIALIRFDGRLGMIVPISVACSGALQPLRAQLFESSRTMWFSHFSNRPGQLFTGAQNRLTIVLTSKKAAAAAHYSTKYHRWDARGGERESLLALVRYHPVCPGKAMFHGLLPKTGCPEGAAIEKIGSRKTIAFYSSKQGRHRVYWVRVPGYFCQFMLTPPLARPEKGGAARVRGEVNDIGFAEIPTLSIVHAILNSSIYYLFFCTYTDTRHINPSNVAEFPIDLDALKPDTIGKLSELSGKLSKCFQKHTSQWRKSGLLIDSIDSRGCKPLLDEIDQVLAKHFQLSNEELDFITNYDIKYRLGRSDEDDE